MLALDSWHRSGAQCPNSDESVSALGMLYNRPIRLFNGRLDSGRISVALFALRALWAKLERQLLTSGKSPAPVRRWSAAFYRIGHTGCETDDISGSP